MKKISVSLVSFTIISMLTAQTGKVMDNLSMPSKILKMDRNLLFISSDYETSERSYLFFTFYMVSGMTRLAGFSSGKFNTLLIKQSMRVRQFHDNNNARCQNRKVGYVNDIKGGWNMRIFH